MTVVNGGTDLNPVASNLSDLSPRLPWWGGDLQTIRNYALSLDHALPSRATQQMIVPLGDGSGDRLVVSLHMSEQRRDRPLVVLIHGMPWLPIAERSSDTLRASAICIQLWAERVLSVLTSRIA